LSYYLALRYQQEVHPIFVGNRGVGNRATLGRWVTGQMRFVVLLNDSHHSQPVAPNVLHRNFRAQRLNEKWVADITGVCTQQGWLFLAGIVDCSSCLLVGWAMRCW
jgi:transposase InsO family protein